MFTKNCIDKTQRKESTIFYFLLSLFKENFQLLP